MACLTLCAAFGNIVQDRLELVRRHRFEPHSQKALNSAPELRVSLLECGLNFKLCPRYGSGIRYAPMRGERMARPDWTLLGRCGIANRYDGIKRFGVFGRKLVPGLRSSGAGVVTKLGQQPESCGVYPSGRLASGAVSHHPAPAHGIKENFPNNAARGVSRAQNQNSERCVVHRCPDNDGLLSTR